MIAHESYNVGKRNSDPSELYIVCAMTAEFYLMADPFHSHDKVKVSLSLPMPWKHVGFQRYGSTNS